MGPLVNGVIGEWGHWLNGMIAINNLVGRSWGCFAPFAVDFVELCPGFLPADSTFCAEVNEMNQEIIHLLISTNTPQHACYIVRQVATNFR